MKNYNMKFTYKKICRGSSDHDFNTEHNGMMCKILNKIPEMPGMVAVEFSDCKEGNAYLYELEEIQNGKRM